MLTETSIFGAPAAGAYRDLSGGGFQPQLFHKYCRPAL
jgi:hypothetical protein